jgi:hypothetical protein
MPETGSLKDIGNRNTLSRTARFANLYKPLFTIFNNLLVRRKNWGGLAIMVVSFIFLITFLASLLTYIYNPNINPVVKMFFGYSIRAIMIAITIAGLYGGYKLLKSN